MPALGPVPLSQNLNRNYETIQTYVVGCRIDGIPFCIGPGTTGGLRQPVCRNDELRDDESGCRTSARHDVGHPLQCDGVGPEQV